MIILTYLVFGSFHSSLPQSSTTSSYVFNFVLYIFGCVGSQEMLAVPYYYEQVELQGVILCTDVAFYLVHYNGVTSE